MNHYAIDCEMSRLTVRAFSSGMLSALSHNPTLVVRDFGGVARFVPETMDQACVQIKVNAASLAVDETMVSEEGRNEIEGAMMRDILEAEKYPEILFCSSKVSASKAGDGQYWINLVGDLSLHGVTGTQPVAAQVALIGDTLRAHGEFTLRQTSYNMKLFSAAGGALKLKDEVKCSFDILARRQQHPLERDSLAMSSREQS